MLTDDRVSHFFDDVDTEQQILKQKSFLTMVFGGPNHYSGKDMSEGHRHLIKIGLNNSHIVQQLLIQLNNTGSVQVYLCRPKETTNKLKTKTFLAGVPSKIYSDAFL